MNELQLPICAFIFSVLLCIVYFSKKRINLLENKLYSIMLICGALDSFIVSIERILVLNVDIKTISNGLYLLLKVTNKFDFFVLIILSSALFIYTILISFKNIKESIKPLLIIVCVADLIFFIVIALLDVTLISSNNIISIGGTAVLPTYICCGIYLVLSILISLINFKRISVRHIPILSIIIIFFFLMFVFKYNPYIMIISIVLTFVNYLMYFTIENPDLKMVQELSVAKNQAEQSNQAKTDFLSSMSHEIRTPLNAIVGFNQCITDAETLDEAKENSKEVLAASNALLEIVNGILDISKIEAGKLEIVNIKYNVKELFESVIKLISSRINEKGLSFNIQIAPDLPMELYGDQNNLKKCILNLLTNAVKYTNKGYINFAVNCVVQKGFCQLFIAIEDSGRGIKPEHIEKLFTKFERLEEDKNTTTEGTGLGLAITKQIIEMMGGKVVVQSVYGSGSKFTIMVNQRIADLEKESLPRSEPVETKTSFKDKKVLIVDDNELNVKVLTRLLEKYEIKAESVTSGQDCINRLSENKDYDLIFMDDMMPQMSGVETLKKLKERGNFKIPTIALTANALVGMRDKYLSDGFSEYLAKPLSKEDLQKALKKFLGSKREPVNFNEAEAYILDFSEKKD